MSNIIDKLIKLSGIQTISPQEAKDRNMFGPLYHGTNDAYRQDIIDNGFRIIYNKEERSHGYHLVDYYNNIPPPIHHLGFGIYLTTIKNIGKKYNQGTIKNLHLYCLDSQNIETINFGANNTMMKWWIKNGYKMKSLNNYSDMDMAEAERIQATKNLTETLKSHYDAVWFKGKGIRSLLDGDQICIYKPELIYMIDKSLAKEDEIGFKVEMNPQIDISQLEDYEKSSLPGYGPAKGGKIWGIILNKRPISPEISEKFHNGAKFFYDIKWNKGGTSYNVKDYQIIPYSKL